MLGNCPLALSVGRAGCDLRQDAVGNQSLGRLGTSSKLASLQLRSSQQARVSGDIDGGLAICSPVNLVHGEVDTPQRLATVALDVLRIFKSARRGAFAGRGTELVNGERALGLLIYQRRVAGNLVDGSVPTFLRNSDGTRGSDTQGEASDGGESDRTNGQRVLLHWSEFLYISSD